MHLHSNRWGTLRADTALLLVVLCASSIPAGAQHPGSMTRPRPDSTAKRDTVARTHGMRGMQGMSEDSVGVTMMDGPLGIPMARMGSGTAWLPDASPMHARHAMAGTWELMTHGLVFLTYDKQYGPRGDDQFGSMNWGMLMVSRRVGEGRLQMRGMVSLDPWTVTPRGYPLLLQSGESYRGLPLHDRQHPHDLFMELAAHYERAIAEKLGVSLYVAPVGEPASGSVAFPHRPSASNDPLAPLGHHWQDATHIAFGVVTAGLFTPTARLEGSFFNGREPDENRTDFDFRRFDSYAARFTLNPNAEWSFAGSYAYLASPETLVPSESEQRITASAIRSGPFHARGQWSTTFIYGANLHSTKSQLSNSLLAESNLEIDGLNTLFGRAEYVEKSPEELAVNGVVGGSSFGVLSLVLGYLRELGTLGGGSIGLGVRGSVGVVPQPLRGTYGTSTPRGLAIFVRVRPNRMHTPGMSSAQGGISAHHKGVMRDARLSEPVKSPQRELPRLVDSLQSGTRRHDAMPGMEMRRDSIPGAPGGRDSTPPTSPRMELTQNPRLTGSAPDAGRCHTLRAGAVSRQGAGQAHYVSDTDGGRNTWTCFAQSALKPCATKRLGCQRWAGRLSGQQRASSNVHRAILHIGSRRYQALDHLGAMEGRS
ncbi:MAG: hypothetical protein NVS4B3_27930 [Gemmatimonadaceae bacterium]